ncbi:MAG TPA: prepilin-type N-terminal cleavage/methylation domain-containing protein [Tepidisphaeraceae bacterium]|jgi:type II secretion system protein H
MTKRHLKGFSLIEILVVITILAIVAAVAAPQLGSRDDLKLASASRMLMSDLMYAQSRSISQQKKHYVQFAGQQYFLIARNAAGTALDQIAHPLNPGNYIVSLDAGALSGLSLIETTFGNASIVGFDELGSPLQYNASDGTSTPLTTTGIIRLQSGQQIMTIMIEPYTGEMSVASGAQ